MDVIPLILSEEAVELLPQEYISRIADCSTEIIKRKVMQYLESEESNPAIRQRIAEAYKGYMDVTSYLNSDETKVKVDLIKNLQYEDIGPQLSVEQLQEYKEAITSILEDERAIPYVAPIRGVLIKDLRDDLKEYAEQVGSSVLKQTAANFKKFSTYFRDKQTASYTGTVVKPVIRNRSKYDILLKGIDFQISKKKTGAIPASWRYL